MALLYVLHALHAARGIELHVLHVNHGLRDADSDADELFVRETAGRLGLNLRVQRIPAGAAPPSGLELWARRRRLGFFAGQMADLSLERIATGHTERDQAETVLFRFLRGAGPDGLRGILPCSRNGFIRPLLCASRAEVVDFLTQTGVGWREDASNADPAFARNRLRNKWLPELREAWNPNLDRVLAQTAGILAWESDYLEQAAEREADRIFSQSPYGWEAPVASLRPVHLALLRRILRMLASRVADTAPGFHHLERIATLATGSKASGSFTFQELLAERSGGAFRMARLERGASPSSVRDSVEIGGPGRYSLPAVPGVIEVVAPPFEADRMNRVNELNSGYTEGWSFLDPPGPGSAMLLRRWHPGDVFIERNSGSHRKLKELFQRFQIPRWRRAAAAVLEMDGEIVWCSCLGASARYAIPDTGGIGEFASSTQAPERRGMAIRYVESLET